MPTEIVPLAEQDRELIRRMFAYTFTHGECYAFAIALHEAFGWPLVGLIKREPSDGGPNDVIWHAGVRAPDGRIHDIRGLVSEEEFGDPFDLSQPYVIRDVTADELYETRAKTGAICRRMIDKARQIAEVVWPELPWGEAVLERVRAFGDALEALCREHGFWIRSPVPASKPVLHRAYGDEEGFIIHGTTDGQAFLIDRKL